MAWTFALLCATLIGGRYLGWVIYPGIGLDASGWRELLQQKLVPVFMTLFAAFGEPPQKAAERAAVAAAAHAATISYKEAFVSVFGPLSTLVVIVSKAWLAYLKF